MTKDEMKKLMKETLVEMIENGELLLITEESDQSFNNDVIVSLSVRDSDGNEIASTEDVVEIPSDNDPYEE